MSRWISSGPRVAFAVLVAAGLTFGAGSAVATPPSSSTCPVDPANGYPGLACKPHSDCSAMCSSYYGTPRIGVCYQGCCDCNW